MAISLSLHSLRQYDRDVLESLLAVSPELLLNENVRYVANERGIQVAGDVAQVAGAVLDRAAVQEVDLGSDQEYELDLAQDDDFVPAPPGRPQAIPAQPNNNDPEDTFWQAYDRMLSFVSGTEQNYLMTNPLSARWKWDCMVKRPHLLVPIYIQGAIGYALSLPVRVLIFVVSLFKLLVELLATLLTWDFSSAKAQRGLRDRGFVFLGATGEILTGVIGCACPPLAYLGDEFIQSNRHIHKWYLNLGMSIWRSEATRRPVMADQMDEWLEELADAADRELVVLDKLKNNNDVANWLSRISDISEFKDKSGKRIALASMISQALEKAEADEAFRKVFLKRIDKAATTCGDRMALSVLYISVEHQISEALKEKDLSKLVYLLGHGIWVLQELETIANNKIIAIRESEKDVPEEQKFGEEVEVYFAYPIKLKQYLKIPIFNDEILYLRCSRVSDQEFDQAGDLLKGMLLDRVSYSKFLATDKRWKKAIQSNQDYLDIVADRKQELAQSASNEEDVAIGAKFEKRVAELTDQVLDRAGFPFFKGNADLQ